MRELNQDNVCQAPSERRANRWRSCLAGLIAFGLLWAWTPGAEVQDGRSAAPGVVVAAGKPASKVSTSVKRVSLGRKIFRVTTVRVPKGMKPHVSFGKDRFGTTATMTRTAKRTGAKAAVNGTYFEAYGGRPEPYGTIINRGRVEHTSNYGTAIGFRPDGRAVMDSLRIEISGQVTNAATERTSSWYAYFVNRTPKRDGSAAVLYTPLRGNSLGFAYGRAVVVRGGVVKKVTAGRNVSIPKDGYVLVFTGTEKPMADRFHVGDQVTMSIRYTDRLGRPIDWDDVQVALGGGPRLVKDGKVALNPRAEGFKEDKILSKSAMRSGIGILSDGSILLATVPSATMKQWAEIWKKMGAVQAMNLDGGASSGLIANGRVVTRPGRELSNVLWFSE